MRGDKKKASQKYLKLQKRDGAVLLSVTGLVPDSWELVKVFIDDSFTSPDREWVRLQIEKVA